MKRWLVPVLALLPGGAAAEENYMEVQRCVWRCLADSPGADSAEYNQCVAAKCNDPVSTAPQPRVTEPDSVLGGMPWSQGPTQDGQGFFAGQQAPDTGNVLYYTCDRAGAQYLLLAGDVEGPAAVLSLEIDGQAIGLWFEPSLGSYASRLEPGSQVPARLETARQISLRNEAGLPLGLFGMYRAGEAIRAARAACGL